MNSIQVKAYAKINLTLDILGVNNGFHDIDSVVATIDLFDQINVKKRKDNKINVEMHGLNSELIPYEENNAARAAELFQKEFSTCGVDITVYKNIPMGAGLGGSSADVAGVLNAMSEIFEIDDINKVNSVANAIGSDCAYMLYGGFARLTGRGDAIKFIDSPLRKLDVVLLFPEGGVSTAQCYRTYDDLNVKPHPDSDGAMRALIDGDAVALGKKMGNALYPAACKLNRAVYDAYTQLAQFDPLGVCMTGSGSAVVAIFENDQFTQYVKNRYKGECEVFLTHTKSNIRSYLWQKKD